MKIANELLYPAPFYNFLSYLSESDMEGPILDCGSGGPNPKQALFVRLGFDVMGIEISEKRFEQAQEYAKENKLELSMQFADMREIPFDSNYFAHIYSYNTIFHMVKPDIKKAVGEMIRVLKPGGLCFLNFLSVDASYYGEGDENNPGECVITDGDREILHTFFTDDESDSFFDNVDIEILFKEKRILHIKYEDGEVLDDAYIDYIVQKKNY
ncbi:MAG: class I SAM-dependent methyltransferase [Promethearchaeota archaeon]